MTVQKIQITDELIQKAQNGDVKSRDKVIELILPEVKHCIRNNIDHSTRQDLIQDSCIRIMNKLHCYKVGQNKFIQWASVVTKNVSRSFYHDIDRTLIYTDKSELIAKIEKRAFNEIDFDFGGPRKITMEDLYFFVDQLPKTQREVFKMFYFEGLKHTEIAEYIGAPSSTSKSHLRFAKISMRNKMKKFMQNLK